MQIHRYRSTAGAAAPEPGFTGDVVISDYVQRSAPSRLSGATVTFGPGSRTPWKVGSAGQTVVVLEGDGRAQTEGEQVVRLRAGDVVWFDPGERHWEGATPDGSMTCVAWQERPIQFAEAVTQEEYDGGPSSSGA